MHSAPSFDMSCAHVGLCKDRSDVERVKARLEASPHVIRHGMHAWECRPVRTTGVQLAAGCSRMPHQVPINSHREALSQPCTRVSCVAKPSADDVETGWLCRKSKPMDHLPARCLPVARADERALRTIEPVALKSKLCVDSEGNKPSPGTMVRTMELA